MTPIVIFKCVQSFGHSDLCPRPGVSKEYGQSNRRATVGFTLIGEHQILFGYFVGVHIFIREVPTKSSQ